jgi:hypothetical protein
MNRSIANMLASAIAISFAVEAVAGRLSMITD